MHCRKEGLFLAGAALPVAALCAAFYTRRALPRIAGEIGLPGLGDAVEVSFDQWGVPHIVARSLDDALFAQGYVTAQDRMDQMELLRRVAEGCLAEAAGKSALPLDVFMRNLGLHRVSGLILERLPADSLHFLANYANGVNAYLGSRKSSLPLELLVSAKGKPRPWTPRDTLEVGLLFAWCHDASWMADLMRGRLIRRLGREEAERLLPPSGQGDVAVLEYEGKADRPPSIEPPPECELEFFGYDEMDPPWMVRGLSLRAQGSNNWVVSGEKTTGGKPILCADPHAQHTVPSPFYLCHLRAGKPACSVIGAAMPGAPGVIMGRNDAIAWGSTSLRADVTDLYIETFEGPDSNRYLVEGSWVDAEVVEEEIKVFPGRRVRHRVLITRHGPVIARDGDKGLALKWVGHDPENDSMGCLVRMGLAGDWEEFTAGLEGYSGPAVNLVYADVKGNIGYRAAGRIPLREGNDGSVPIPGDKDEHRWKGYIPPGEMPQVLNPDRGWIATANSKVVGEGYPHLITTMWEPSSRQGRIAELLASKETHDVHGMRRMQGDLHTRRGRFFCDTVLNTLREKEGLDPGIRRALSILEGWDCRAEEDSVAQAIYFMTWRVLTERILRHRLGHRLYFEYTTSFCNLNEVVEGILRERRQEWLHPSATGFDDLILQCLKEAVVRLENRYGTPDMSQWGWGRLHSLEIPHFLGFLKPLGRILNLGPVPCAGDGETVCCSMPESDPTVQMAARSSLGGPPSLSFPPKFHSDRVYAGAVFRMIVDLSGAGKSLWCLDAGQCSNPFSRFYRNFFPIWRGLGYAPMAFMEEEVKEVTRSRLILKPAARPGI